MYYAAGRPRRNVKELNERDTESDCEKVGLTSRTSRDTVARSPHTYMLQIY